MGLLLSAFFLVIANRCQDYRAGESAREMVEKLQREMEVIGDNCAQDAMLSGYMGREMPSKELDGKHYIGILQIPVLELTLPVLAECNAWNLDIAPCLYEGTVYEKNMVIAGHNYRTHFGNLKYLSEGMEVDFLDVEGKKYFYSVKEVEVLEERESKEMCAGGWELTLFTCTYSGDARYTVRCERIR